MNAGWRFLVLGALLLGGATISVASEDSDKVRALEDRVHELEAENARLKSVGAAADPAPADIHQIDAAAPDFEFLKLGESRNYLKEERHRIIDQIETFIPPLYEPVRPFHAFVLPPGAFRFTLANNLSFNDGDFGRSDFYSLFFNDVHVKNLFLVASIFYGFELPGFPDLTANLSIPYRRTNISGTGHAFRIDPMVMTMTGDSEGLGDISLTVKKKWLDQADYHVNLATFTGVIFPSGEHDQKFNDAQTLFVNGQPMAVSASAGGPKIDLFSDDLRIPHSAQPGNGVLGARVGFALTRQFERSALHGGVIADLFANNNVGHEVKYGLSYVFPPLASDFAAIDLSAFGQWKGNEHYPGLITHPERDLATGGPVMDENGNIKMFTTTRPDFKHDFVLFLSPSLIFIPLPQTRIYAGPSFRVLEPRKGPSPFFMFDTGISVTF